MCVVGATTLTIILTITVSVEMGMGMLRALMAVYGACLRAPLYSHHHPKTGYWMESGRGNSNPVVMAMLRVYGGLCGGSRAPPYPHHHSEIGSVEIVVVITAVVGAVVAMVTLRRNYKFTSPPAAPLHTTFHSCSSTFRPNPLCES